MHGSELDNSSMRSTEDIHDGSNPHGTYRRLGEASNPGPSLRKSAKKRGDIGKRANESKMKVFFSNITAMSAKAEAYIKSRSDHIVGVVETHLGAAKSHKAADRFAAEGRETIFSPANYTHRMLVLLQI